MSPLLTTLAELAAPTRHMFLSPHYDDIPLSTGATVRLLSDEGRTPETTVVFGSEPDSTQPLSDFAQSLHDAWGFTAGEVIASRRSEEAAAAEVLGSMERVLPFRDAIYRERHYLSDDDLFGLPAAAEDDLPAAIAASLDLPARPTRDVRIYAPLGVGRHVDHQIVQRAATRLAETGWEVWYYEDIPYALKPGALEARLAELATTAPLEVAALIPARPTWEAKLDAILSYPSQLETVFRSYVGVGTSREEISEALRAYARAAGEGALVERYWHLKEGRVAQGVDSAAALH
jgi:LmbE family N-acetylglucosaminyl deacetylase